MTDQERIEKAAKDYNFKAYYGGAVPAWMIERDFKAGVAWRDANPSSEVEALVRALEKIWESDVLPFYLDELANNALKAYRARTKGEGE